MIEFSAELFKADEPTINGRVYSKELCERLAKDTHYPIFGTLGQSYEPIDMKSEYAVVTDELTVVKGSLMASGKILDTPTGKIAQELINAGCRITFASAGLGDIDENGVVDVNTFQLSSVDLVMEFPKAGNKDDSV